MGIMRKTLLERLKKEIDVPVAGAYGYITKYWCEKIGLEKSHINDASVSASIRMPSLWILII